MPHLPPLSRFVSNTGVRIYRIPCRVFETLSARVYLLLGAGPVTLVDTGSGLELCNRDILAGLETVRREFGESVRASDVRRILVSHGHIDHIGGLPELCRAGNVEVVMHALDSWAVTAPAERTAVAKSRLREFLNHAGVEPARREEVIKASHAHGQPIAAVAVTTRVNDGDELDGLRILHTPGHSPGHVCIAVGNMLLSADHILARTVPQQWPESIAPYTGLGHYLDSLDKIQSIPGFETTLPAHEQIIEDVYARIHSIRAAHMRRLDRLLAMLRRADRPLSVGEIAEQLYPDVTGFRAALAITDVGARVEYLHQRDRLRVADLAAIDGADRPVYRYVVA
jgi:glyoxylase-like metal-dependent hydrolase (beta-lactamase superfamily II)